MSQMAGPRGLVAVICAIDKNATRGQEIRGAAGARVRRPHRIDFDQASLVAAAFLDAPRTSKHPTVLAAYVALSDQASRLFACLTSERTRHPIRIVFTGCREPYTDACELSDSVRHARVLEVSPSRHDRDRRHPLLDTSVGGAYDQFRAVHDIVSHGWLRYGFCRNGEFAAWLHEDGMYTGLARWALATELHGEHSVRWTSGIVADHKSVLLDTTLINASRDGTQHVAQPGRTTPA